MSWKNHLAEVARMRSQFKPLPAGWPFHHRPDLKAEHDKAIAKARRLLERAAELRRIALEPTA